MTRLLLALALAFAFLAPSAPAQEKESYESLNRQAIDKLVAGKHDEGAALLQRILAIPGREKDEGTAYNLACAYSLKGDVEKGFEWLGKAVDWGWGRGQGSLVGEEGKTKSHAEMTRTDPDLANLRKDPRFEPLMERMSKAAAELEAKRKKADEYAATAAIHVPEKAKGLAETPVLVVLHDAGSTKDAVVAGRWKDVAEELGFVLIAPSGKVLVGDEPAKGMAWFATPEEYKQRYWAFEKPITDALTAFKKDHTLDKARVVIAGEGQGGVVALNTAVGNPGILKGVVAWNAPVDASLLGAKAPTAGKMGLRAKVLLDPAAASKHAQEQDAWRKSLQTWAIGGDVVALGAESSDPAAAKKALVDAVKAVLERDPAAAPASAPAAEPKKP